MRNGIFLLRILIDENNNIWIFLSKHCFSELAANTIFCYLIKDGLFWGPREVELFF